MGIKAEIEVREQPETVVFNIRTSETNMLIGKYGVNLNALQYLARVLARRKVSDHLAFLIDVDDYKKERESRLLDLAEEVYKEVAHSGKTAVLRSMPSYERRVIHAALSGKFEVVTNSLGEEPARLVVVSPAGRTPGNLDTKNLRFGENEDYILLD